jgi:hypothetical protein
MASFIAAEDMRYPTRKLPKNVSLKIRSSERLLPTALRKRMVFLSLSPRTVFRFGIGSFRPVKQREFQIPYACGMKLWHGSPNSTPVF